MGGDGFADGVNSGTNAFFSALGALSLSPGSEVIVPAITDIGGVSPIFFHSLVPIMADVDKRTYNICSEEIEPLITRKTKAIVVTHVAGEPVDMSPIITLAKQYNLKVIEDCAQSHGAEYKDKKVGTIGDISFFSTMPGKHHCTGGQGGVVFSNNEDLIVASRMVADRGKVFNQGKFTGDNIIAGLNCNMDELSAAIGCVQIKKLPSIISSTYNIGEYIKAELNKNSIVASVGWQPKETKCVYWFIRLKINLSRLSVDKNTFSTALAAEGVPVANEYRSTPFSQPWYEQALKNSCAVSSRRIQEIIKQMKYSNVEKALASHINIFIRENYSKQDVDDILEALKKVENAYLI
jgi:dTDP-4-amino-4,6-dideoxygalactose transaminase